MKVYKDLNTVVRAGRVRRVRESNNAGIILTWVFVILCVICWAASCQAEDYTDSQIVEAIKQAEGKNRKGWYSYGIKSVKCETEEACRKICFNTVRNNRARFIKIAHDNGGYVSFLSKRYCPIGASNDPQGLNKNWLKNVNYFLSKNKTKE